MLYRLKIKGTKKPSYLFGTMHLQNDAAFTHKPIVLQKIAKCEAFATEFKLDDADESKMAAYMKLPEGDPNSDGYYENIERVLQKRDGMYIEQNPNN